MDNKVHLKVFGRYALFTDPLTRIGGEKFSYQIPTYEALKGILESVYWKPTFTWVIDRARVLKAIRMQAKGTKPLNYNNDEHDLAIYTYLYDVEYQVEAHFEWNQHRTDLQADRNENKHFFVAKRMIERGGRRDVFLGTRECQGYIEPCDFGSEQGYYDNYGELAFGLMLHGFDYPSDLGKNELQVRFWHPKLIDGVINFARPADCPVRRRVKSMPYRKPAAVTLGADQTIAELLQEEGR